ncbi:hypothetical protein NQ314_018637 [Rhamnusium bicolor]|uniref:Uncharacterized protein n=1 Tax=Rhamnusium bicolor TaxID=1586634 RepID=A0AAV8WPW0_9CUCU|nr:hypothetical protein NQ314_018637 [Rhamnusium bicolor]
MSCWNDQTGDQTKIDIKQTIDPGNLGINILKIKQVSDGGVIILCENKKNITVLQTKINQELGKNTRQIYLKLKSQS